MTSSCRLARLLGSGVIIAGLAALTRADDVTSGGLGLDQVVHATLSASPELKLAAAEVELAAGALTGSRAAFDFKVTTTATASRTTPLDAMGAAAVQKDVLVTAGAQRLLRNGVLATSEVALTRSLLSRSLGSDTAKADVRFGVSIPLLRDRGGASSAAAEQAAARDHEAARWGASPRCGSAGAGLGRRVLGLPGRPSAARGVACVRGARGASC